MAILRIAISIIVFLLLTATFAEMLLNKSSSDIELIGFICIEFIAFYYFIYKPIKNLLK